MPYSQQNDRDQYPPLNNRWFAGLVAAGVLLNATGLLVPILEPDGALYACIAKVMAQTGDPVNLYAVGTDWLDKPHFQFWVTALSYQLLGVNTVAYKLPALLFFLGSAFYTYRFARLTYSKLVAQVATLVQLTALHGILSNSDVRAEPYLTGLIIGAVYHFYQLFDSPGQSQPTKMVALHLLVGSLMTGGALMTKGLFILLPIGAGLLLHALLTRPAELLRPRWWLAVGLSLLFTLPELYALYVQFDLHPEKVVFGRTGVSGVRFFFWDSQFGRFFNTGPIKGQGDKLFFVHTTLWAFLPWSLPLYVGVGKRLMDLFKRWSAGTSQVRPSQAGREYVTLGSGLATFLLFSLSGFQLPHYIIILFPFFSIITADFLVRRSPVGLRQWTRGQTAIGILITVLLVGLLGLVQPPYMWVGLGAVVIVTVAAFALVKAPTLLVLMGRMVGAMSALAIVLNLFVYPTLMPYQAGMTAARYASEQPALARRTTLLYEPGNGVGSGSFWTYEFYAQAPTLYVRSDSALRARVADQPELVFTTAVYADSLRARGFQLKTVAQFPYYHVSRLTYPFLNHATRAQTTEPYVLTEVSE